MSIVFTVSLWEKHRRYWKMHQNHQFRFFLGQELSKVKISHWRKPEDPSTCPKQTKKPKQTFPSPPKKTLTSLSRKFPVPAGHFVQRQASCVPEPPRSGNWKHGYQNRNRMEKSGNDQQETPRNQQQKGVAPMQRAQKPWKCQRQAWPSSQAKREGPLRGLECCPKPFGGAALPARPLTRQQRTASPWAESLLHSLFQ